MKGGATNTGRQGQIASHSDLASALRLCHPRWEILSELTFEPDGISWQAWCESIFLPTIQPALETARTACTAGELEAILSCDRRIDAALSADRAEASRRQGSLLISGFPVPPAERIWRRYEAALRDGAAPGHLAVAFAVRAAAFHLSPGLAAGAYALMEAHGGCPEAGLAKWEEMADLCLAARQRRHQSTALQAA